MGMGKDVYNKKLVGETGHCPLQAGADAEGGVYGPYEKFQSVVSECEAMEGEGLIRITQKHQEQSTGRKYIDHVTFVKLK